MILVLGHIDQWSRKESRTRFHIYSPLIAIKYAQMPLIQLGQNNSFQQMMMEQLDSHT